MIVITVLARVVCVLHRITEGRWSIYNHGVLHCTYNCTYCMYIIFIVLYLSLIVPDVRCCLTLQGGKQVRLSLYMYNDNKVLNLESEFAWGQNNL